MSQLTIIGCRPQFYTEAPVLQPHISLLGRKLWQCTLQTVHNLHSVPSTQVARIREVEVPEARAAEASAWRAALQRERASLEEMYASRVARLRERDAVLSQREAASRREVEAAAATHRSALAEEAAHLRAKLAVRHAPVALTDGMPQVDALGRGTLALQQR